MNTAPVADTKVPEVNTSQLSQAQVHPVAAPVNSWVHPSTMMAPFTNYIGSLDPLTSYTTPVLNIFNRAMNQLNHLAGRDAMLIVDVTEKEFELVIDAHIGAPKESELACPMRYSLSSTVT